MRLTKCDFMRGVQCPKMLWLDKHEPQYKVIPPDVRERLDAGNVFGDKAMGMFGEYVEMTAHTADGHIDCATMLANTQTHVEKGAPVICEAAFAEGDLYCAVDILRREDNGAYSMYEVKNTAEVETQFILDAAFQYYVVSQSVKINKVYIVTRGENDTFVPHDISELVAITQNGLPAMIRAINNACDTEIEPNRPCNKHCETPYRCWYWDYCHKGKQETKE